MVIFKSRKEAFENVFYEWNANRENLPFNKKHFADTFKTFAQHYIRSHRYQFKNLNSKRFIQE